MILKSAIRTERLERALSLGNGGFREKAGTRRISVEDLKGLH